MRNLLIALVLLVSVSAFGQDANLFKKETFTHGGTTLLYRIMYPENYDSHKKYPLIVFMHGSGERGNDNTAQLAYAGKVFIEQNRSKFPAIVILPQCPNDTKWESITNGPEGSFTYVSHDTPTPTMDALCALIKSMLSSGKADKKHVYVGGLSMGGYGTFDMLWRMPNTFAAAFPICGGGDPSKISKYAKNTSLWIFHGEKDDAVPVECSRVMYKALKEAKTDVLYTEYPGVTHNSWDNALTEKELMPWLFSK